MISLSSAQRVVQNIGLDHTPSAYQVGGGKGMLTVVADGDEHYPLDTSGITMNSELWSKVPATVVLKPCPRRAAYFPMTRISDKSPIQARISSGTRTQH
jgi:hypothetical protein